MPTVVVPFAGPDGKTRLQLSASARRDLSHAMLGDVLAACVGVAPTRVVTPDRDVVALLREAGAEAVADPGGGQGAAVEAALATVVSGPVLVVNADLPCVGSHDLWSLLAATGEGGLAMVQAADGTTNALGLYEPTAFAQLYGPGSAARFREHAAGLGLEAVSLVIPNLADDVDSLHDLRRLEHRCGPRTRACLAELAEGARS